MLKFWKWLNELYGWLLILVFGLIMLIGVWQMYDNYYLFYHTLDKSIVKYKPDPANPSIQENSPITDEMVAWLTIDGTDIDYPVMQGKDNSHFLNTDPFGAYSLSGSIFLDSRCSADFSDEYAMIYGHHMDYGKMFGALDDFINASYLKKHSTGTLIIGKNAEKIYQLEVFASMRVSAKEKVVFDMQETQIRQFIFENAPVLTNQKEFKILGLSTCADTDSVSRIVVFCYLYE